MEKFDDVIKYPKIPSIEKLKKDLSKKGMTFEYEMVKEKLDGSNFRFVKIDNELFFGSRNVFPISGDAIGGYTLNASFKPIIDHIKKFHNIIDEGYIYFGEAMLPHKIKYENPKPFYGFDVYDMGKKKFLREYDEIYKSMGIDFIPYHNDDSLLKENPVSFVDGKSKIEGMVYVNYSSQQYSKFVFDEFKEVKHVKSKPKGKKWCVSVNPFEKYITESRVFKRCLQMEYDNMDIDFRTLMTTFVNDIIDEIDRDDLFKLIYAMNKQEINQAVRNVLKVRGFI